MRSLSKTRFPGDRGDGVVTPNTGRVSPREPSEINGLGSGVTGVTPKRECRDRSYKYTHIGPCGAQRCTAPSQSRFGGTPVTRRPNPLFLLINWCDTPAKSMSPPSHPTIWRMSHASG